MTFYFGFASLLIPIHQKRNVHGGATDEEGINQDTNKESGLKKLV